MSDGKSSSYRVVSAEELRRRALQAARDRFDRARTALKGLEVEQRSAAAVYGALGSPVTVPALPATEDPDAMVAAAERAEAQQARQRAELEAALVAARGARVREVAEAFLQSLAPTTPLDPMDVVAPRAAAASSGAPADATIVKALELIDRLPAAAPAATVSRCERIVDELSEVGSGARADALIAALRSEVQQARVTAGLIESNRARVDGLYAQLDGLDGSDVAALRGELRGLPLDVDLPADLDARVAEARQRAERDADRAFALRTTRAALAEQGYDVGEGFETVVATEAGALVPLEGFTRHAVRVRERGGRLLFNVVRYDEGGLLDRTEDTAAATEFCRSFDRFVDAVGHDGLRLDRVQHLDAGSGHVQVLRQAPPQRSGRRTSVPRARERR